MSGKIVPCVRMLSAAWDRWPDALLAAPTIIYRAFGNGSLTLPLFHIAAIGKHTAGYIG